MATTRSEGRNAIRTLAEAPMQSEAEQTFRKASVASRPRFTHS